MTMNTQLVSPDAQSTTNSNDVSDLVPVHIFDTDCPEAAS